MARPNSTAPVRRLGARARLMAVAVASCYATAPAWALNAGDLSKVVGDFTASHTGNVDILTLTTASSRTLVEAQKRFNVLSHEKFNIIQPTAASVFLLRVVPQAGVLERSVIDGSIYSNGQFWLQNAAGALISKGAVIDTAGFLATTMAVRHEDFLAGRLTSLGAPGVGSIENKGTIKTSSGGSVYLIGANVTNEGVITTPEGETILAAGQTVNLIDTGTPGVKVEVTGAEGNVTNLGTIVATAGRIGMAGVIVKNSGTLNASSVASEGGRVFLKASKDTYVDGAGRIVATGTKGGRAEVLGNRVAVMDQAQIDVSGAYGGGTVLVGGDYQGKNPNVKNATITYFGPQAKIKADAIVNGDGGKVILWADDTTRAYGNISARGGAFGGNGGFVETSGHNYLDFHARVDTRAPNGAAGTLLLDPADVTIDNGATSGGSFSGQIFSYGGGAASLLSWADIISQLGLGNVVITTTGSGGNGDITINAAPSGGANISISHTDSWGTWSNTYYGAGYTSSNSLSLLAHRAVNINAWFGNAGGGAINIMAGWNGASTASPAVYGGFTAGQSINIGSGGGIVSKGSVSLTAVDSVTINGGQYSAGIELDTGALSITANSILLTGGSSGFNDARARIATNGDQTYTVGLFNSSGGLKLNGSNGMATYGGGAEIALYGSSGTQSFTIQYGATVELRGGSSYGGMPVGGTSGSCSVAAVCSNNGASIRNNGNGGQSFVFTAGGSLNLYGGSVGNDNSAEISNRGTGTQTISGSPTILVRGGSSGGTAVVYGGKVETLENAAEIESKYGMQTINAATMSLEGGTAVYGGAYVSAPTQNITVSGALSLTGGGGTAPTGYDAYGDVILTNAAIIGRDAANTINLNVGSLSMQGGTSSAWGGSWALIGGYRAPSTISVVSGGNIALTGGGAQWSNRIGSIGGYGGSVSLVSTQGAISLDNAYIGTGSTGSVTISGYGGITQSATGRVETDFLTASATQAGADIHFAGENKAGHVAIVAPDLISYIGVAPAHFTSLISTSGSISANVSNLYGYGGWVGLGSLSAINGSVNVSAAGQIIDDNGSGANVMAKSITLSSTGGTTDSNSLAISADVGLAPGGTLISATVSDSATYGGISIRNGSAVAPATVTLTDHSTSAGSGKIFYSSPYDVNMATSSFSLSSHYGGITLWSGGFLTLAGAASFAPGQYSNATYGNVFAWGQTGVATGGTMNLPTAIDLNIGTAGSMTIGHGIGNVRNLGLYAAGNLDFLSGSSVDATANVYMGGAASALAGAAASSTYGGGTVTLNNAYVKATNGTIVAYSGGDIRLNNGSYLEAGYDVNLGLGGASSTVYLNDAAGYANPSYVLAGSGNTGRSVNIGLPGRTADGVVIDGSTTMASTPGGSGLFVGNRSTPAVKGAGLNVVYGVAASAAITGVVNEVVNSINTTTAAQANTDTQTPTGTLTTLLPPSGGGTSSLASLATGTVGGGTGEFGGSTSSTSGSGTTSGATTGTSPTESGSSTASSSSGTSGETSQSSGDQSSGSKDSKDEKKEDKKDDKAKKADSGEKKDDKSNKQAVGKCSA